MNKILSDQELNRMEAELSKVKYTCKCGRRVVIPYNKEKEVCSWCGNYVFKSKQEEFKYRFKEKNK